MFTRNTIVLGTLTTTLIAGAAQAEDILIVGGGDLGWSHDLRDILANYGHDCVVGPNFWDFVGNDLEAYDAVLVLASNYPESMPGEGQYALNDFVESGGGLVTAEWFNYTLEYNDGGNQPLSYVMRLDVTGWSTDTTVTYSLESEDATLNAGLPSSFTFGAHGYITNNTEAHFDVLYGATAFYTSAHGPAVVGWNHGLGRMLSFNTLMTPASYSDANYQRLVANALTWSTEGGLRGDGSGDRFGHSMANIGSTFSTNDFVVGAPFADVDGQADAGQVTIHYGTEPSWYYPISFGEAGDRFGWAVAALGDVTGDGGGDFAVSAPRNDAMGNNAGAVHVIDGVTWQVHRTHYGEHAGDQFGYAIDGGLDCDGDGVGDLLVGAPKHDADANNTGAVYVFSGATGAQLHRFAGEAAGDLCGWSVAMIPDIDGDNLAECLVGEPKNDRKAHDAGRVTMFSAGEDVGSVRGNQAGARFGYSMAAIGDVNWDGYVDIAIGSPYFDKGSKSNAGRIDVLSGAGGNRLWKMKGGKAGQRLGHCVANAGDLNGDGVNEVAVGAPKFGNNKGRVYVRDGWSGVGIARVTGENDGDFFGQSIAGNITGWNPNTPGIAIGAPKVDTLGMSNAGQAYLFEYDGGFGFVGPVGGGEFSGEIDLTLPDPCDADLNGDGFIDAGDVVELVAMWGACDCDADLTGDGAVDGHDLIVLMANFGVCEND